MKNGVTLIELLVVIAIIITMTLIGAGSYQLARRSVTLDIETDRLAQLFETLRTESQKQNACVGLMIKAATGSAPEKITTPFRAENPVPCDFGTRRTESISWKAPLEIAALTLDQASRDELVIFFLPPRGRMEFATGGSRVENGVTATVRIIARGEEHGRSLEFNRETGRILRLTSP